MFESIAPNTGSDSRRLSAPSMGERLDAHRGSTSGFDYLRIVLSFAVIGWHSVFTTYGIRYEADIYASWIHPIIYPVLPMFFSLGGFLVTASLFRTKSFGEYFLLRVLRFFPALFVVVVLTAIVVGPLLTSTSLYAYFHSPKFFAYFLNAFGYFEGELPGVFLDNPAPQTVNVSLWTIPWEFGCSIALYGLILCRDELKAKCVAVVAIGAMISIPLLAIAANSEASLYSRPPGHLLVLSFLAGTCVYFFRYRIPFKFSLFVICALLSLLLFSKAKSAYLALIPIGYVTAYLGLLHPPKIGFMKRADLSYGIYLYGCLVQQTFVFLFPSMRVWWVNWIVSAGLAALCAACSWRLVEGPILRRKRQIIAGVLGSASAGPTGSELVIGQGASAQN
jgi:peptidoglycan/LPS O-acetylase OafA/YrhL